MNRIPSVLVAVLTGLLFLALVACNKPKPPTLVPREVRVTAIDAQGITLLVKVEATNPNAYALSARSLTAKLKMDDKYDMGSATVNKPLVLPPNVPTEIEVPVNVKWSDASALGSMAAAGRPVPYTVDGTVNVGTESINLDVPFTVKGTVSREQLVSAVLRALPMPTGPILH